MLHVEGKVTQIRKDFADNVILELATANRFEDVDARLGKDSVEYSAILVPGDDIVVLCRGAGMMVGRPILDDCYIKVRPD